MPAERIRDTYEPWFRDAFAKAGVVEKVVWELGFGAQQHQTPEGVVILPVMMVYCCVPSATIGDVHHLVGQLPALGLTSEIVEREVRVMVEKLLELRTAALSLSNGGGPTSMPWPPPDGLPGLRPTGS